MVTVYVPPSLRRLTDGCARVVVHGSTVAEVLNNLVNLYPEMKTHLVDSDGGLPRFLNVYLNDQEIGDLQGIKTRVNEEDHVELIPAIAGGAMRLSPVQVQRYHRHLILPEVGGTGQRKLLNAKVLLIGAGGLGSPAALYLAAAGVGTLGIADFDRVDMSNLHRQILHGHRDLDRPKTESAKERLADVNPDVRVVEHTSGIFAHNALDLISEYDIVVNGCDNFPTRYLVNDACVFLEKPLVDGSIFRFEGQATVFLPGKGCYRCLFPTPPPAGAVPNCAEAGVLGVLPGIIGTIQAMETIKLILGLGDSLAGRLMLFDALGMEFREVRTRRDPECPVCGDSPTITELIDYEAFCGVAVAEPAMAAAASGA